jgi:hypothetical protein
VGGRDDLAKEYLDLGYETYKEWMANRRNPDIDDNPEEWLKTMVCHEGRLSSG